jgi:hypothetical protein
MKVLLSTSLYWGGYWHHSGDEVDLPDELARKYIVAGSAEPIAQPIETAALQTTPPKGRRNERITAAGRQ